MEAQQQQEPPQIRSSPYQSPMYNFGSSIVMMTDPSSNLHELELTLRGLQEDANGNIKEVTKPMMNETGISFVVGLVTRGLGSRNTVFSNLKESEVRSITNYISDGLSKNLLVKRLDYGISNISDKEIIFRTIISYIFITLKRPQDEGEKRFWRGSVQEIKTTVDTSQQKKGIFGRVFGW